MGDNCNGIEYVGHYSKLQRAIKKVAEGRLQVKLLGDMFREGLFTRDIWSFEVKQANIRQHERTLNIRAMKLAMRTKAKDARKVLEVRNRTLFKVREEHLENNGRFELKKIEKEIKQSIAGELSQLEKKNKFKIEKYKKTQYPVRNKDHKARSMKEKNLSPVPQNLFDYKDLSVFGAPSDLPKKEKLKGVYNCNPNIILSEEEQKILERDPKFNLMRVVEQVEFNTELEP